MPVPVPVPDPEAEIGTETAPETGAETETEIVEAELPGTGTGTGTEEQDADRRRLFRALGAMTAPACRMPPRIRRDAVAIERDLLVAAPAGQRIHVDVARPAEPGPHPAVLVIHGGGWRNGLREHVHGMMQALALSGYVGVAVEYRLVVPPGQNTFPAAISDCRCAVRYVRREAAALGVDPDRIAAVGYSAGGHLAALLATAPDVAGLDPDCPITDVSPAVQAAVAFYPPVDLRPRGSRGRSRIVTEFLGASPFDDPARAALASPIVHVDATDPPMLLLHGDSDRTVPVEQSRRLRVALRRARVPVAYIEIPGADHGFTMLSTSPELRVAGCATLAFLARTLTPDR